MRASTWFREAVEDTRAGASRPWLWGVSFLLLLCAFSGWDLWSIGRISSDASTFRGSGASIWITDAQDEIDARSCDALEGVDGIDSAGGVAATANTRLSIMPDTPISTYVVTPGFVDLVLPSARKRDTPGVLISENLASEIGATPTSTFESEIGPITFDAIFPYPNDGRLGSLQNAILIVADSNDAEFDACWYDVWPFTESSASIGILAANEPALAKRSQLNTGLGIGFDLDARLDELKTWLLLAGAFLSAGVLGWITIRMRRSELASVLHSNVERADLVVIIVIETLIWSTPAATVTLASSGIAMPLLPEGPTPISSATVAIVTISLSGALMGAITASATIRESKLFTYLRDRR